MNAKPPSPTADESPITAAQWLSALADGQAQALEPGLKAWRQDPEARATWHRYHLIGDLMRSEELAQPPGRDAEFLARLQERLRSEPVPLAPAASSLAAVAPRRWQAWVTPAAMAAGFVAVAGVLVVTRLSQPEVGGPVQAQAPGSALTLANSRGTSPGPVVPLLQDQTLIRNAELDRYLEAHRGAMGGSMAVPGGVKRNAELASAQGPAGR